MNNVKEAWYSKNYFGHLTFYYEPNAFSFPITFIFDDTGVVVAFGFCGINWTWKKYED